jgi:hypothetical protein
MGSNDQAFIPADLSRAELIKRFNEFMVEDEYASKLFWKHFGSKRSSREMPVPSIQGAIDAAVNYDDQMQFDVRMLLLLVHPEDKPLAIDVCKFVSERYVNNPEKPAGQLTLRQFKADLARRMCELGF